MNKPSWKEMERLLREAQELFEAGDYNSSACKLLSLRLAVASGFTIAYELQYPPKEV